MLSDYTFLTDHSYSLRPVGDDNDEIPLKKREEKNKKPQRSSNRTIDKTTSTTNRTASVDRSSSDKENNSSSSTASISVTNKNPSMASRRSRLSTRIATTNSGKKQDNKSSPKTGVKSTTGSIVKKKKVLNRGKTKLLNISQLDFSDASPSLSIEERVKLRRTKSVQPSTPLATKKTKSQSRSIPKNSSKKSQSKKNSSVKTTKSFLGSGLDLDNIVLGNRQRRSVQT